MLTAPSTDLDSPQSRRDLRYDLVRHKVAAFAPARERERFLPAHPCGPYCPTKAKEDQCAESSEQSLRTTVVAQLIGNLTPDLGL